MRALSLVVCASTFSLTSSTISVDYAGDYMSAKAGKTDFTPPTCGDVQLAYNDAECCDDTTGDKKVDFECSLKKEKTQDDYDREAAVMNQLTEGKDAIQRIYKENTIVLNGDYSSSYVLGHEPNSAPHPKTPDKWPNGTRRTKIDNILPEFKCFLPEVAMTRRMSQDKKGNRTYYDKREIYKYREMKPRMLPRYNAIMYNESRGSDEHYHDPFFKNGTRKFRDAIYQADWDARLDKFEIKSEDQYHDRLDACRFACHYHMYGLSFEPMDSDTTEHDFSTAKCHCLNDVLRGSQVNCTHDHVDVVHHIANGEWNITAWDTAWLDVEGGKDFVMYLPHPPTYHHQIEHTHRLHPEGNRTDYGRRLAHLRGPGHSLHCGEFDEYSDAWNDCEQEVQDEDDADCGASVDLRKTMKSNRVMFGFHPILGKSAFSDPVFIDTTVGCQIAMFKLDPKKDAKAVRTMHHEMIGQDYVSQKTTSMSRSWKLDIGVAAGSDGECNADQEVTDKTDATDTKTTQCSQPAPDPLNGKGNDVSVNSAALDLGFSGDKEKNSLNAESSATTHGTSVWEANTIKRTGTFQWRLDTISDSHFSKGNRQVVLLADDLIRRISNYYEAILDRTGSRNNEPGVTDDKYNNDWDELRENMRFDCDPVKDSWATGVSKFNTNSFEDTYGKSEPIPTNVKTGRRFTDDDPWCVPYSTDEFKTKIEDMMNDGTAGPNLVDEGGIQRTTLEMGAHFRKIDELGLEIFSLYGTDFVASGAIGGFKIQRSHVKTTSGSSSRKDESDESKCKGWTMKLAGKGDIQGVPAEANVGATKESCDGASSNDATADTETYEHEMSIDEYVGWDEPTDDVSLADSVLLIDPRMYAQTSPDNSLIFRPLHTLFNSDTIAEKHICSGAKENTCSKGGLSREGWGRVHLRMSELYVRTMSTLRNELRRQSSTCQIGPLIPQENPVLPDTTFDRLGVPTGRKQTDLIKHDAVGFKHAYEKSTNFFAGKNSFPAGIGQIDDMGDKLGKGLTDLYKFEKLDTETNRYINDYSKLSCVYSTPTQLKSPGTNEDNKPLDNPSDLPSGPYSAKWCNNNGADWGKPQLWTDIGTRQLANYCDQIAFRTAGSCSYRPSSTSSRLDSMIDPKTQKEMHAFNGQSFGTDFNIEFLKKLSTKQFCGVKDPCMWSNDFKFHPATFISGEKDSKLKTKLQAVFESGDDKKYDVLTMHCEFGHCIPNTALGISKLNHELAIQHHCYEVVRQRTEWDSSKTLKYTNIFRMQTENQNRMCHPIEFSNGPSGRSVSETEHECIRPWGKDGVSGGKYKQFKNNGNWGGEDTDWKGFRIRFPCNARSYEQQHEREILVGAQEITDISKPIPAFCHEFPGSGDKSDLRSYSRGAFQTPVTYIDTVKHKFVDLMTDNNQVLGGSDGIVESHGESLTGFPTFNDMSYMFGMMCWPLALDSDETKQFDRQDGNAAWENIVYLSYPGPSAETPLASQCLPAGEIDPSNQAKIDTDAGAAGFLGCYNTNTYNLLRDGTQAGSVKHPYSLAYCRQQCTLQKYTYFAIEQSQRCFCGNIITEFAGRKYNQRLPQSSCQHSPRMGRLSYCRACKDTMSGYYTGAEGKSSLYRVDGKYDECAPGYDDDSFKVDDNYGQVRRKNGKVFTNGPEMRAAC